MRYALRGGVVVAAVCAFLALGVWYWRMQTDSLPQGGQPQLPEQTVAIGSTTVQAEIASTDEERQAGLSGRTGLSLGSGMLFVFDSDDKWGFWMPQMLFSIDIIWIDATGRVVSIASNVSPESYPKVFYPSENVRYVLEVPAGFASANHITDGSPMSLPG